MEANSSSHFRSSSSTLRCSMLHLKPFYPPLVASKEEKEALKPKPRPALPVYLAQTSPLSPSVSTDTTLFPSVQHNLTKLKEQLAAASKDLGRDGVVVFPEYALQGILRGSEVSQSSPKRREEMVSSSLTSPPSDLLHRRTSPSARHQVPCSPLPPRHCPHSRRTKTIPYQRRAQRSPRSISVFP